MSQVFAIAPGTQITNSASITFDLRGRTYVVSDADTLVTASDAGNSLPHTLNLDSTSIPENAQELFVGRLAALDVDPADTLSFSTSDSRFRVAGDSLFLAPGVSFDFETTAEVRVQVKVRDTYGGELTREFVIPVTNVNETPYALTVPQSSAPADIAGAVIGPVTALDPDVGDTLTYTVDDRRFLVVGGELRLSAGQSLVDREQVTLTIEATDIGGLSVTRLVALRASRFTSQRSAARIGRIDPLGEPRALSLAQCGVQAAPGVSLVLPANHNVVFGDEIRADEPVVLEIVDADANLDRAAVDVLFSRFQGANGDEEVIRLLETGIDTGVFTAVIGLTSSVSGSNDCRLAVRNGDQLRLDYVDARDALDQAVATASVRLLRVPSTTASIALLTIANGTTGALDIHIENGRCGGSVGSPPRDQENNTIALPADLSLQPSSAFLVGDTVFVRVTDLDENRNSATTEQLEVVVRSALDEETVVLNETAADSGIFAGYINTSDTLSAACALSTVGHTAFSVSYVDADDAADSTRADGFITGFMRVFSASTGALVDGALVSLVDATTGLPATGAVTGLDGISESPASVRSGQHVSDSGGRIYRPPAGAVVFPRIRAGRYRLQVVPVANYSFPSFRSDAQIDLVAAGRYRLAAGSRGAEFTVDQDGNLGFDIPLDPLATGVFVTKEASAEVIEVGDFVQYRIRVQSESMAIGELSATLVDQLPAGFRYRSGSARLDNQLIEPEIDGSGTVLTFTMSPTSVAHESSLTYVVEASVASRQGNARNTVVLQSARVFPRPTAFADVIVRDSMLGDRGFLVGQVREGCDAQAPGVSGVRVLLENGSYALTDSTGRFHFEDLEAGTHVVQLDPSTIPESLETLVCRQNSRIDSDGSVQFVDLAEGSIARVGFALTDAPPPVTEWSLQLDSRSLPDVIEYSLLLRIGKLPVEKGSVGMILPDGLRYVAASSTLDGNAMPDPVDAQSGALTFALPSMPANSRHRLKVRARALPGVSQPEVKAMVTLATQTGKHRSRAVSNIAQTPTAGHSLIVKTGGFGQSGVSRGTGAVMPMPLPVVKQNEAPYLIPTIDEGDAPEFSAEWLTTQPIQTALIWPQEDYNPRIPVVPVIIVHPAALRPVLSVDGGLVNPVAFTGTTTDHARGLVLSRWKDVPISEGNSLLRVQFMDASDQVVQEIERSVHFGQAPVRAELVSERSFLVADGVNPPMLAIRFFDRQGRPARPGLTGEFSVNTPFKPLDKAEGLEVSTTGSGTRNWQVRRDGLAFIQLEPTTRTGDVLIAMNFGDQRQEKVRARLKPGRQDLVVVGLAESRLGQSDHPQADDLANRMAFYAKGMVRGDWLVTAAYDTDKDTDTRRDEQLDPGQFYPLYGDGSEQRHDAVSQRKFYVKAERDNIEFEAGDFETGFERSELARYNRTLNGVRSSWNESGLRVQVFASDSADTHVQDVLRPDGTSGLYRLSRAPLSAGTENVSIVTRDRLHTERELDRQTLMRYLDYSIDYDRGTLLFKQPIQSQDDEFNPVFIEVGYDVVSQSGGKDVVIGSRATVQLDDRDSELGVTILRDTAGGANLELNAIDLHMQFTPETHLQLEAAQSSGERTGPAEAVIASVQYRGEKAAGELYYREQDLLFGAGLAPATEADTRKYGIEGEYRASDHLSLRGEVFRQATMQQGGTRDVASIESRYAIGSMNLRSVLQSVQEETVAGDSRSAQLVGVGVSRGFLDGRLGLRADSEFSLSSGAGSDDYPDRTLLGAEMAVTPEVTLLIEQELAATGAADSRHTRIGVRARPWTGNSVESWIGQEMTEQGARLFSNTGLVQQWQVNQHWLVDAGFDQVKTLNGATTAGQSAPSTFNPAAPPVLGNQNGDFTAWFAGATMRRNEWHVSARLERHTGDQVSKWNGLLGAARQLSEGKSVSASVGYLLEALPDGGDSHLAEARIGAAWRPDGSPWSVFNRLDLNIAQSRGGGLDTRSRSITENMHLNWQRDRHEVGLVGGLRFANGRFDADSYDGLTMLAGAQYRFDLNSRWDIGAQVRVRRSLTAGVDAMSAGVEVGRTFARQAWVSLGYNFAGFADDDFAGAQYSEQGPYLKFRMRFDQRNVERFLAFVGMDARPSDAAPRRPRH